MRWGSKTGPGIDELNKRLLDTSTDKTWYASPAYNNADAALAWGVPLDEWEQKSPEYRGQMIELLYTKAVRKNWEAWVNRPKKKAQ